MKRKIFLLGALVLCLTGCGQKTSENINSSEQKAIQAKAEQLQKDNKSILQKLKKIKVITRTFVFPKDDKGTQQTQIVTYVGTPLKIGDHQCDGNRWGVEKGIQQVGIEEAQKQLRESFNKDDAFKEALTVPGFTADLTLENENEYKVTITYDFEAMDVKKAEGMTYFKNNHLPELLKLTPSQFADNLINAGASEQKIKTV